MLVLTRFMGCSTSSKHAAKSTFYHVLAKKFAYLRIPRSTHFSACDTCSRLKNSEIIATHPDAKRSYRTELETHRDAMRADRDTYDGNK